VQKLPDVGYVRQLNAEGILSLRPTLVLASAQAQPSLVLKKVEENNVKLVNVPGGYDVAAIDKKVDAVAAAIGKTDKGPNCAKNWMPKSPRCRRSRLTNACCLFSATAEWDRWSQGRRPPPTGRFAPQA
jgi:ABC-type hemin transport system substrate-binding protein